MKRLLFLIISLVFTVSFALSGCGDPDRNSEPAEANSGNVKAGYTDKGDIKFGNNTFNVAVKEAEKPTNNLYTKLTEKGLLLISIYNGSLDDPEVKAIIENVTLK